MLSITRLASLTAVVLAAHSAFIGSAYAAVGAPAAAAPEIDVSTGVGALALLLGVLALVAERRSQRNEK